MSKSMVLFETADGAVLPLSGTALSIIENGNRSSGSHSVLNGKQSPRFRRAQMATVEIDFGGSVPSTPARMKNGKNSIDVFRYRNSIILLLSKHSPYWWRIG